MLDIGDELGASPLRAERRYLTILFVDLVGYTALSEEVDPEELSTLQRRYQVLATTIMESFGGIVAQFTGDGVLVYFGYPLTSKYDVQRAMSAALELVSQVPAIDTRLSGRALAPLAARAGVHTGLVMLSPEITRGGVTELRATGEAVNLAARLQQEAPPGGVVTSKSTLDLAGARFEVHQLGSRQLKGLSQETILYQVIRPLGTAEQLPMRNGMRLYGREQATGRLVAEWQQAKTGRIPRAVVVEGDAGVGKTRFVQEFLALGEVRHAEVVKIMCDEIFANTALYPLSAYLWRRAGLDSGDDYAVQQRKIAVLLQTFGLATPANIVALGDLLGLTDPVLDDMVPTIDLAKRQQLTLTVDLFLKTVTAGPTILWIDDVHWLDPSTAELLGRLVATIATGQLLIILTRRSYPRGPELPAADGTILLEPIDTAAARQIARSVAGAKALSEGLIARAIEAAEGLPLFIEQLVISLVEKSAAVNPRPERASESVPLRLATMMSERLDRRPGARRVAQVAACIGRSFVPDFLTALLDQDRRETLRQLDELVDGELLVRRLVGTEQRYEFRHALIQRIAYESVLMADRLAVHGRIADRIAAATSARPEHLELLAYHLTRSARIPDAIAAWLRVGQRAARNSANREAVDSLHKGVDLLPRLEDNDVRAGLEVQLRLAMIGPLIAAYGAAATAVSDSCERGLAICRERTLGSLALPFAFGQFTFANCSGATGDAARLAELFLATAIKAGNLSGEVVGERLMGTVLFGQGEVAASRRHMERSLALYDAERDAATTDIFGQNTEVHTRSALALALFTQGEIEPALTMGVSVLRKANQLRHPHSTVMPLTYVGGWLFGLAGATAALTEQASALCALTERHGMRVFAAYGAGFLGWAKAEAGDLDDGERLLAQCVAELDATGIVLALSGHLTCHAECLRRLGRLPDARTAIDRAISLLGASSYRWFAAEALRVEALVTFDEAKLPGPMPIARLRRAAATAATTGFVVLEWRCLQSAIQCGDSDPSTRERVAALAHLADLPARIEAILVQ